MRPALACHDALARRAVEGHRGIVVKMTGDGLYAAFPDALDAVTRDARAAAGARRSGGDRRRAAAGALRLACGRGRAPRQRLLRQRGQPHGAHHGRGARRAGDSVAGGLRSRRPAVAGGRRAARPGLGAVARPGAPRARLPDRPPGPAAGLSGAALAGGDAQQPAAAGHARSSAARACWPRSGSCSGRRAC